MTLKVDGSSNAQPVAPIEMDAQPAEDTATAATPSGASAGDYADHFEPSLPRNEAGAQPTAHSRGLQESLNQQLAAAGAGDEATAVGSWGAAKPVEELTDNRPTPLPRGGDRPSESDGAAAQRFAATTLMREPVWVQMSRPDGSQLEINPIDARMVYLELNGLTQEGNRAGDREAADSWRQNALQFLERNGSSEDEFYTLLGDAQSVRQRSSAAPGEVVGVRFDNYDAAASASATAAPKFSNDFDATVQTRRLGEDVHACAQTLGGPVYPGSHWAQATKAAERTLAADETQLTDKDLNALQEQIVGRANEAFDTAIEKNFPKKLALYANLTRLRAFAEQGWKAPEGSAAAKRYKELEPYLDTDKLDAAIAKLVGDPELQADLEKIQASVQREVVGASGQIADKVQRQEAYLSGEQFQARLDVLATPDQRQVVIGQELQKLAAFDPEAATRAGQSILGNQIANHPERALALLDDDQLEAGSRRILAGLAKQVGIELTPGEMDEAAAAMVQAAKEPGPGGASAALGRALKSKGGRLADKLNQPEMKASLNTIGQGFVVVGLALDTLSGDAKWDPATPEFWKQTADVATLGKEIAATVDLTRKTREALLVGGAPTALGRVAGGLGGVASLLSTPAQAMASYDDFARGDAIGATFKAIGTGTSIVGGTLTVAAAVTGTGVGAPVGVTLSVVAASAAVADTIWGRPDSEVFLYLEGLGESVKAETGEEGLLQGWIS